MNYREVLIRLMSMTSPFVYDDEETFLEMLRKFYKYLHELTSASKEMSDDIKELRDEMNDFEAQIDAKINDINELLVGYDMKIEKVENDLKVYVDNSIIYLRGYVDNQISILNHQIEQIELGNISAYDPTTGLFSPIQTIINNLYDIQRDNSLTASEYDALELTATEYDAYEITARDYDINAKNILV